MRRGAAGDRVGGRLGWRRLRLRLLRRRRRPCREERSRRLAIMRVGNLRNLIIKIAT
jgi:hypothetical protein